MSKVRSYYIITGWAEGRWHSRRFGQELEKRGLVKAPSAAKADIIIGHSAGCYMLPSKIKAETVVLINPPYWPGKSMVVRIFNNSIVGAPAQIRNWGLWWFVRKRFWNGASTILRPLRIIKIWRSLQTMLVGLHDSHIVIVRSSLDVFCSPDVHLLSRDYKNVSIREMKGLHEDCWHNPAPYIDLLLKELY